MIRSMVALLSIATLTLASPFSIERRDAPTDDSITYCETKLKGADLKKSVPCTKTSDPLSEVLGWLPYNFTAHYECYVNIDNFG